MNKTITDEMVSDAVDRSIGRMMTKKIMSEGDILIRQTDLVGVLRSVIADMKMADQGETAFEKAESSMKTDLANYREDLGLTVKTINGQVHYNFSQVEKNIRRLLGFTIRMGKSRDFARDIFLKGEKALYRKRAPRAASTAQVINFPSSTIAPVVSVSTAAQSPVIESLRNDSIRSQIKDIYPLAMPYIDILVDEAAMWLGDRVVKRGNARTCSEADFLDLVRDYLSKPNLHVKCRDAQAVKLQRINKTPDVMKNPAGVPIITTGSMMWIAEQDLLDYASFMAQTAADLEREHALARQEIEGLTMVLNARNKTVA